MNTNKINFIPFPALHNTSAEGLLAMGGNLNVDTLVSAYRQGIFPWFNQDQPILWWSPDPRLVLFPNEIKISRSLAKRLRQKIFHVTANQAFEEVIQSCSQRRRGLTDSDQIREKKQETWITDSMLDAYLALNKRGYAHSVEVWRENDLVGGLYGLAMGDVFFGESMFSSANDASKVALAVLCAWLNKNNFKVIDCQVASDHLFSLGAREITRSQFLEYLESIDIDQPISKFARDISHYTADSVIKQS